MSPNGNFRKPFFGRTFSKLEKGSLRGSIFSLCAAAIGSEVLSLPYVLRLCGYVNEILFMLMGAVAAETTLRMLASIACNNGLNNYSKMV
jgi:amino acid permease